jgi:rhamnosyltransferase
VDIEYSLRLKKHGKVSIITRRHGMIHKVGSPKYIKILGINISSSNHDSLRRYYMARNHIILVKEYFVRNPYFIAKASYFFILDLAKIVIVEDNKFNKIFSSIKGIIEGVFYSSKKRKLFEKNVL